MTKLADYSYTWTIKNFSFCFQNNGDALQSPFFQTEVFGQNNFLISFYPRGHEEESEEYVTIYFDRCKSQDDGKKFVQVALDIKIELLNAQNVIITCADMLNCNFNETWGFGTKNLIKIEELIKELENSADFLTIRCHIVNKDSTQQATECEAQTKIGVDRSSIEWELKMQDDYNFNEKRVITLSKNSLFEINFTNDNENLIVKMTKNEIVSSDKTSQLVTFRISFLDNLGMERFTKQAKYLFTFTNKACHFKFIQVAEFITEKENLIIDGKLVLKLELSTSNGIITSCITKFNKALRLETSLQENFLTLFKDKKLSDVILKVKNETFSAHKFLLASRSPVFSAMFSHDTVESQTGVVEILDVDAHIMNLFLEFIYTSAVREMDYESALKLLVVSDKYDVQSLNEMCSSFIMSALCVENVCEVLDVADMVSHTLLKEAASAYIQANASVILPSLKWRDLIKKNFKLAADIFFRLSKSLGGVHTKWSFTS